MSVVTVLVAEGDSLTATASYNIDANSRVAYPWAAAGVTPSQVPGASTFGSYAMQYWPFYNGSLLCLNRAVGGSRLSTNAAGGSYPGDLVQRAPTWIDALINAGYPSTKTPTGVANNRAARKYILSVMIGSNPNSSGDYTGDAANFKTYLQNRVAAGFTGVVVCTIPSRGDGVIANFETYRQGYNAILRSAAWLNSIGARTIACADFGAEPTIGAAGACNDATLFVDTVHPAALGYTYMTPLWLAAVNQVKAAI